MKVNINPETFKPVHLREHFDLQTYVDLGLDLGRLTDPSEKGLIRRLRIAAAHYVVNKAGASDVGSKHAWGLHDAYSATTEVMHGAVDEYKEAVAGVTVDHPAIQAYALRNPAALGNASRGNFCTSSSLLEEATGMRGWLSLVLIRPNDAQAVAEKTDHPPYSLIEGPACGITSPLEVAPQLVHARLGVAGIVGL